MSESSYGELQSPRGSTAVEERREVTAVSIPGRFLPEPETIPTGRLAPEKDEPSLEVAAAVHRLVASTDDAARGLSGFCWDPDEEPAATPMRSVATTPPAVPQIPPAVALPEEYTPLPVPMLPPADVLPAHTAADLPRWESAPGLLDIAEPAPTDFLAAPPDAAFTFRVALPVPNEDVAISAAASLPSENEVVATSAAASVPNEVEFLPREVNAPPSEVVSATSEVTPRIAAPIAVVFSLKATPPPDQVIPGITDPDWAPVGFSPEMVVAAAPSSRADESPAGVNISPLVAPVPAQQMTAAVVSPNNSAAAANDQRTGIVLVAWTWMLRVGLALWGSMQALVSAGWMRLRTWPLRLRIFGERVRSAAARLGQRVQRPDATRSLPRDSSTTKPQAAAPTNQGPKDASPRTPGSHRNGA